MRARDNPFRTDRVLQIRYRLTGTTWPALLKRLAELEYRAALVGPEGSGKTTLLEDLAPRLAKLGFTPKPLRLDRSQPTFPRGFISTFAAAINSRDVVLLDGAELMGTVTWRWFKHRVRRVAGLIITTHHPGRLPTLLKCTTTPALLREIVAHLLQSPPPEMNPLCNELFQRHRGNLRNCLRELYDRYAEMDGGAPTTTSEPAHEGASG